MKITTKQLRRIIREGWREDLGPPPDIDAPGWHPNDSQEWERQADSYSRQEYEASKEEFLATEQARWEDHWELDTNEEAAVVTKVLSEAYDKIIEGLW